MNVPTTGLQELVTDCLRTMVASKGDPPAITKRTNPIHELGLESIDGLAFACLLSEKLHFQIPNSINPFVDEQNRARKVGEIINLLNNLLSTSLQEEENARR